MTHTFGGRAAQLIFLLFTLIGNAWAGDVMGKLPNNITVSAQYIAGEKGKPVVLVLHGAATTRNFSTVQSIVNELAGSGYSVLAPTLSMNINDRRASVPCDAIHTTAMQDDVQEIDFWVNWLAGKGHQQISLIGHSLGSLQLVAYASDKPHKSVNQVIATSLIHTHRYTTAAIIARETAMAREALKQTPPPIQGYHFVFCEDFLAPPQVYLSYMAWDEGMVIDTLNKSTVPVTIIMGEKDRRFGPEWIAMLRGAGSNVVVIEGASHFFDATHEFDLLDVISEGLE